MSGPYVQLSVPPSSYFTFPPPSDPRPLPPYQDEPTFAVPFNINPSFYRSALSTKVPFTFAVGYMTLVAILNQVNRRRGYRPWPISKTRFFYLLAVAHNIILAVYSGVTCAAMITALRSSFVSPLNPHGIAASLDSLCKMSGPRGYGDAVTFNTSTSVWSSANRFIHLGADGITPDASDVGRIWNEGLAFWGWFFYLSKFYEVLDTAIILAKGKRSSTLQTYHHAGAMLSMWAGIRYMSPPIWLFVAYNSGIHTLMYTYYTLTLLGVKVPKGIKQTLTTMQIMQFFIGMVFATLHLYLSYTIPVSIPYKVGEILSSFPSSASSAASVFKSSLKHLTSSGSAASAASSAWKSASSSASSALSSASGPASVAASSAAASASHNAVPWLKKLALLAAGAPGVAYNVRNDRGDRFGPGSTDVGHQAVEATRYHTVYETVQCIDTAGQAWAIWLNVFYLVPLAVLFIRFFVKSYIWGPSTKPQRRFSDSTTYAMRKTSDTVETLGRNVEQALDSAGREVQKGGRDLQKPEEELNDVLKKLKESAGGVLDTDESTVIVEDSRFEDGSRFEESRVVESRVEIVSSRSSNGRVVVNQADPLQKPDHL